MNIYGAVIFGILLIGLIFGAVFHDPIINGLTAVVFGIVFIPAMLYFPWRFVIHPATSEKWERNKEYFKYKQLRKNFFICYEPHASRPWKSIFFLRLKKSS